MRKLSKRAALFASSAVLAMPGVAMAGTAHADATSTVIRIWGSSHCMDNATENFAKVQMWDCTKHAEQNWFPVFNGDNGNLADFSFRNKNTNLYLTAPTGGGGGTVVMSGYTGDATQQWLRIYDNDPSDQTDGSYQVWESAASPGWCLNTNSVGNGTALRLWPCDITDHYQKWHFDN
ncbi:hypothetical protein ABIA35_008367 [Catenulispora sp. MAP12-49]|uniref:RICIN domain-containing protein n=1 Tax=Catenulispora sp. MAP12-49 TaxID=3156302 RepID=UPI003510EDC3